MSSKYEERKIIYESAASVVILVRHKSLGEDRIVKRIPKDKTNQSIREAEILLNLRHPNIPIMFDLEEDEKYFYIVEEYIRGHSLADYVNLYHISHTLLMEIAIAIFDVLNYLHSRECPICYQDMKLENVMIGDRIVVIDYGIATFLKDSVEKTAFGTISYSSSRQLAGECVLENDIYSTKELLRRLYDKSEEKRNIRIEHLINHRKQEKEAFYYLEEWKKLYSKNNEKKHLNVKIAVVGNDIGVGVTHISVALNCFLNNIGVKSIYIDKSQDNNLEKMYAGDNTFKLKEDRLYHGCFAGEYITQSTKKQAMPKELKVFDCGTNVDAALNADIVIYVQSSRVFKSNELLDVAYDKDTVVIINPRQTGTGAVLAKALGKKIYAFPLDSDPFSITRKKTKLFNRIWRKEILGEKNF